MVTTIPLSDAPARAACVVGNIILLAASVLFLSTQSGVGNILLYAILCAALLFALILYTIVVFSASIDVNPMEKTITQNMLFHRDTNDVSRATQIRTREVKFFQSETRVISICDADGKELLAISAMLPANKGARCEIPAQMLAVSLGITFIPTVDKALYDKSAKSEKSKRDTEAARHARKGHGPHLMEKHAQTTQMPTQDDECNNSTDKTEELNYDEMDDQKI